MADDIQKFFNKAFKKIEKQAQFATAVALTKTAHAVRVDLEAATAKFIDRPAPRTRKSFGVNRATKANLVSEVFIKDHLAKGTSPATYLTIAKGGKRGAKRSEKALRANGLITHNQFLVPASIRLNKFGNVTQGTMNKILSGVKGQRDAQQNSRTSNYFIVNPRRQENSRRDISPGIYQRKNKRIVKLFHLVNGAPSYRKEFNFHSLARKYAAKHIGKEFKKALAYAASTAK